MDWGDRRGGNGGVSCRGRYGRGREARMPCRILRGRMRRASYRDVRCASTVWCGVQLYGGVQNASILRRQDTTFQSHHTLRKI